MEVILEVGREGRTPKHLANTKVKVPLESEKDLGKEQKIQFLQMTSHRNWRFVRNEICFTEELTIPFPVVRWIEKQYIKQYTVHLMLYQSLFMLCIPGSMSQSHAF